MSDDAAALDSKEEALSRPIDKEIVRRLLLYLKPYRKLFLISIALLVLVSATDLAGPMIVKSAIDGPIQRHVDGLLGESEAVRWLMTLSILYVALIAAQFGLRFAQNLVTTITGQRVIRDVRREVFAHLEAQPVAYYDRHPVGSLVSRVTGDVEALSELFTSGAVIVFQDVLTLIVISGLLLVIDVKLAIVAFAAVPPLLLVSEIFRRRSRESYRDVRRRYAKLNAFLNEHVSGIRVTKLFSQERRSLGEFAVVNRDYVDANVRSLFNFAVFYPVVDFLAWLSLGSIVWFGGGEILAGRVSYGEFVQFWLYVRLFFEPIRELSEKYNVLQAAMAASERIFKILDTRPDVPPPAIPISPKDGAPRGEIVFEDVWFAYREGEWILKDLSLRVEPGQVVAVVGATGAGKSTLASLVSRLRDVQKGRILVDGVDVRDQDPYELRRRIAVVLQDVFLFSGTVLDNIRLGERERISRERAEAAARIVHADRFIKRLAKGYDSEVQERGATLSAGERQLLSFARALAFDPKILILDEATSNIDTETESLIQDAIAKLLKGRTALIIAHRLSTIRKADRIVVMHHGEVRESGTHEELLRLRGIYYRLYELQYVAREPAPVAEG